MFEIIEDVEELPPGGMKVRMLQFDEPQLRTELLQPMAYVIASAQEDWLPPSLHKEFVEYQEDIKQQEKREAIEERKEELEKEIAERRKKAKEKSKTKKTNTKTTTGGRFGAGYQSGTKSSGDKSVSERLKERLKRNKAQAERLEKRGGKKVTTVSSESTTDGLYREFEQISITEKTNFADMNGLLVFWAHDDTVEPGKSYRYRLRLGVFNPIAGTNQFVKEDEGFKNKVVLWSDFSDITETVEIPERLYFFPLVKQKGGKGVTVQVFRYVMGYWYVKDFKNIEPGEAIGDIAETKREDGENDITIPEKIDYGTGAVVVDVVPVNDWTGGKNVRYYFDMLYSRDGTTIERRAVKSMYWARELQAMFTELKKAEKEPKEPLRDWGRKATKRNRRTRTAPKSPRPGTATFDIDYMDD